MANPWNRSRTGAGGISWSAVPGISRLFSSIRSDRGGGCAASSLVVRTGFPISLADPVVKNRGRLKKPSRKKKTSLSPDTDSITYSSESSSAPAPFAASSLVVQTGSSISLADPVVKNRGRLKNPSLKNKPSLSPDIDYTNSSSDPSFAPSIFSASSLVVQTGSSTSLADPVVKKRGRLKKPSHNKKPSLSPDKDSTISSSDPCSAPATVAASPPTDPRRRCAVAEDNFVPVVENNRSSVVAEEVRFAPPISTKAKESGFGEQTLAESDAAPRQRDFVYRDRRVPVIKSSRSHYNQEIPSLAPSFVEAKRSAFGIGFGLLLVKMIVLAVLAIGRKKLVAGITFSAFIFWLLDSAGCRVFGFFKPCSDTKNLNSEFRGLKLKERGMNSDVRGLNLKEKGLASPVREVCIECHSDATGSERSSLDPIDLDQGRQVFLERKDHLGTVYIHVKQGDGPAANSKKKKLLRKFVPKRFRRRKDGKDDKMFISDTIEEEMEEEEEAIKEEQEEENTGENVPIQSVSDVGNVSSPIASSENVLGPMPSDAAVNHDRVYMKVVQENEIAAKLRAFRKLAFLALIILGLYGGKGVALILTIFWFLSGKSTKFLRKNRTGLVF